MVKKLLAVAVTALAVTACAADTGSDKGADRADLALSCGGSGTSLSTANASGGAADLLTAGKPLPADDLLLAAGPTGELLIESGRGDTPGRDGGPTTLRPGTLTVLDPATGRTQLVRGKDAVQPGTQTVFGDLDHDHVVWMQETGTNAEESDWTIYAADRRSGKTSLVAKARPVDANGLKPTVPGYTVPQLHDGMVFWAEARRATTAGAAPVVSVFSRGLDVSSPEKLVAPNAILPTVTGSWLYYVPFDGTSKPGYEIQRRSLRTGKTETIRQTDSGPGVTFLTADGEALAWALSDGTVEVSRKPSEPVVRIATGEGEQLSWLSAGRGLVGFGDGSGQASGAYVFDLRRNCLHDLAADAPGADVVIGGQTVAWTYDAAGEQRWRVGQVLEAGREDRG